MLGYDDFKTLKKDVAETWDGMAILLEKFDWAFFTDEAAIQVEAYEILNDSFKASCDSEDLVKRVAEEIINLENKIRLQRKVGSKADAEDNNAVLKHLVKYIRENFPEDICNEHTEFDHSHYVWGCR